MRRLQPVLWTKGTLLSPQHLQLQDRFTEDTLQFWLEALAFSPWGFSELQLDQEALGSGLISISSASGIFRDGLLFEIPSADPAPPAKPLAEHFSPGQSSLDVYLAIPHYREGGHNIATANGTTNARYIAASLIAQDELQSGREKPVLVARKEFRLLLESESRQGYSTLRIARVNRTPAGVFRVDPAFVPPLLDLAASPYLMTIARRLFEILGARSTELADSRRRKNESLADFTSSDIASFWMLYTLNTHYPRIRHILESRRGHPEALFSAMATIASALTTLSPDVHPRDLPVYDHDDLSGCFTTLDTKLRNLLDAALPKTHATFSLKQAQASIYAASLAEDRFFQKTRFYLGIRADMDHGELIRKTPQFVKVAAATHIENMVRHALPALPLTHSQRPPANLPVKPDFEYFSIAQSGQVWEAMTRARNVAAYVPADFPGVELELVVLF
jgi:type VI secretion system protein ImpJ